MKRFFIFVCIYTLFLCIPIKAENIPLHYKIYTSKESEKLLPLKEEVLKTLDYLCNGVQEESYKTIIKDNLDLFVFNESIKVHFKKNTLYLVVEEGKGKVLHGIYEKNLCFERVEKKSLIKEMLRKGK